MSLKIMINELPWNVYYVPYDHAKLNDDDNPAMGITYFGELNTYISNNNICDALIERVCRHEATHMTLFSYGFNGDDMDEEDICNFFECHGEEICTVARKMAVHYEKEKEHLLY